MKRHFKVASILCIVTSAVIITSCGYELVSSGNSGNGDSDSVGGDSVGGSGDNGNSGENADSGDNGSSGDNGGSGENGGGGESGGSENGEENKCTSECCVNNNNCDGLCDLENGKCVDSCDERYIQIGKYCVLNDCNRIANYLSGTDVFGDEYDKIKVHSCEKPESSNESMCCLKVFSLDINDKDVQLLDRKGVYVEVLSNFEEDDIETIKEGNIDTIETNKIIPNSNLQVFSGKNNLFIGIRKKIETSTDPLFKFVWTEMDKYFEEKIIMDFRLEYNGCNKPDESNSINKSCGYSINYIGNKCVKECEEGKDRCKLKLLELDVNTLCEQLKEQLKDYNNGEVYNIVNGISDKLWFELEFGGFEDGGVSYIHHAKKPSEKSVYGMLNDKIYKYNENVRGQIVEYKRHSGKCERLGEIDDKILTCNKFQSSEDLDSFIENIEYSITKFDVYLPLKY